MPIDPKLRMMCDRSTAHRSAVWVAGNRADLEDSKEKES